MQHLDKMWLQMELVVRGNLVGEHISKLNGNISCLSAKPWASVPTQKYLDCSGRLILLSLNGKSHAGAPTICSWCDDDRETFMIEIEAPFQCYVRFDNVAMIRAERLDCSVKEDATEVDLCMCIAPERCSPTQHHRRSHSHLLPGKPKLRLTV